MDKDIWNQMPVEFKQLHGCLFIDHSSTEFLVCSEETDFSRLESTDGRGVCLNPALPREYELRVYEVVPVASDPYKFSYAGLSGQFGNIKAVIDFYGVSFEQLNYLKRISVN